MYGYGGCNPGLLRYKGEKEGGGGEMYCIIIGGRGLTGLERIDESAMPPMGEAIYLAWAWLLVLGRVSCNHIFWEGDGGWEVSGCGVF
jgi:hypothetical protein